MFESKCHVFESFGVTQTITSQNRISPSTFSDGIGNVFFETQIPVRQSLLHYHHRQRAFGTCFRVLDERFPLFYTVMRLDENVAARGDLLLPATTNRFHHAHVFSM